MRAPWPRRPPTQQPCRFSSKRLDPQEARATLKGGADGGQRSATRAAQTNSPRSPRNLLHTGRSPMRPISLTLKGFRGIRDGLGRDVIELDFEQLAGDAQLIAMVGSNGRGKTTIIDNMTPFPIMPSRGGADGLGSFSY